MDTSIKTLIESYNTTTLVGDFGDLIESAIDVILPVGGAIALTFFAIKIVRRILHI